MGANGVEKITILECIEGIITYNSGSIEAEIENLSDRIIILKNGKIAFIGTVLGLLVNNTSTLIND